MSYENEIQLLIDRATEDLPITVEHEVLGPKRIFFRITHDEGKSGLASSERVCLFRLERCLPTMEAFFKGISEVWFPQYR